MQPIEVKVMSTGQMCLNSEGATVHLQQRVTKEIIVGFWEMHLFSYYLLNVLLY